MPGVTVNGSSELPRILSLRDAYFLIVGNIIGIGIFTTTGYVSEYVPSAGFMLLLWLLGGIFVSCGGFVYAELSSRFPLAGGDFHYLSHAFHPLGGFLFGWSAFAVTYTGSIATIATGFSHYALNFAPQAARDLSYAIPLVHLKLTGLKIIALLTTLIFTYLNVRGIRSGSRWQNIFTVGGLLVAISFFILGIFSGNGNWQNFAPFLPLRNSAHLISNLGVALIGIYFTYAGWTAIVYIAGEVKTPERVIPRALSLGILTVAVIYLMLNLLYLYALPLAAMHGVVDIGYQAFLHLRGAGWSAFFSIMIMVAVLSTLNATILSGSRIYYAMSRNGLFVSAAGRLHRRHGSPSVALWLQFGWTALLILSGSFNQLLTYTVFVMVCFATLSSAAYFILRFRDGIRPGIYAAWGYPVTPLVFLGVSMWIMVDTLIQHPLQSIAGAGLVIVGIPFYFYFRKNHVPAAPARQKENMN
jgi:basic amino acid/polyamine antiporter, APA family